MAHQRVFQFLRDELTLGGRSVLTLSEISAMAAIEGFLADLGEFDETAFIVASISTSLPGADRSRMRETFGELSTDLFERLRSRTDTPLSVVANAARIAMGSSRGTELSAALAAIVGELALSGDKVKITEFINQVDLVVKLTSSAHQDAFRAVLNSLESRDVETTQPAPSPWIISLSIDMAGSTEAKSRMLALVSDVDYRHQLYAQLCRLFIDKETRFYRSLFRHKRTDGNRLIDWGKLFVVKGIGDEIWLLYEISPDEQDAKSVFAAFIESALWAVQETVDWSATEREMGPDLDHEEELNQRSDSMQLPLKFHMDLIQDAAEISELRAAEIGKFSRDEAGQVANSEDYIALANRLAGGFVESSGRMTRTAWRTDYIGHDVDRFFRTSKAALPGIVSVGEALFDLSGISGELAAYPGLFRARISGCPDVKFGGIYYLREDIPSIDLKGIGYSYSVYQFTTRYGLNWLHRNSEAKSTLLDRTRNRFTSDLRLALQTTAESEQEADEPEHSDHSQGDTIG